MPAGRLIYVDRYKNHNREVNEYFKDRPDDLLVMDVTAGDGWEKLCPFLGVDIPDIDFPPANKAKDPELDKLASKNILLRIDAKLKRMLGV